MKASDVMTPVTVVTPDDPAEQLVDALEREDVRAVAVVSAEGEIQGLVTDEDLLYALLPAYALEDEDLLAVLERDAAGELRRRLEGKRVKNVVNVRRRQFSRVRLDDSLVQVTSTMARAGEPILLVVDGDHVAGVVTVDALLPRLLGGPPA